ncbi:MAG: hypothetical protein ACTSYA_07450 [Candidatus Kariarchaeaceae archaeon]
MKKIVIILLVTFLFLIIGGAILAFSYKDVDVEVGSTTVTSHITETIVLLVPTYEGYISIDTDVSIYNSGLLAIKDLTVKLKVYLITDANPLVRLLVGEGENKLGDIASDATEDFIIAFDATENIPTLALFDGTLEVELEISLQLEFIPYTITIDELVTEDWTAPFVAI